MTSVTRRRFLGSLAAGAGLAPLVTVAGRRALASVELVSDGALCAGTQLLQPGDLEYVGRVYMPVDDPAGAKTRFGYSLAAITGRRVNGELRIFITGASGQAGGGDYNHVGDALYEVRYEGPDQRSTLVRNWGDVTGGRRLLRDTNQGAETRGIQWLNGQLWWAYGSQYFTGSDPDPSIGVSILDDSSGSISAFGPWRTQEHSQKTRGYMVTIPPDFATAYTGGRQLAVGAPPTAGNANGPRGSVISALDAINPSTTPADQVNSSHWSLGCQRMIYHDSQSPQERNGNYKICGWNVLYDDSKGGFLGPGDPNFNNNTLALDTLSAAAWIRTSSRQGVIFVGQITDVVSGFNYGTDTLPHMWYGPAGRPCIHGQVGSISLGTGPQSATIVPVLYIYDPTIVAQSAAGTIQPWSFPASSSVRLDALTPTISPTVGYPYQYGGAYFDQVENLLFISEAAGEIIGEPRPALRVFRIPA